MSSRNTQPFLQDTLQELQSANINTWVFGGWAEELCGLRPPGPHGDIDLLFPAEDFSRVDHFLRARQDREEVPGKRFVHKQAFLRQGVLVELFLVPTTGAGLTTDFFGLHLFHWPADTLLHTVSLIGVPVPMTSPAALRFYREQHQAVEEAYRQHLAAQEGSRR